MASIFLQRNVEYKIKGVNYYRTIEYTARGYERGLLFIFPYEDIKLHIITFGSGDDINVKISKYSNNKLKSETEGIINRRELTILLDLD